MSDTEVINTKEEKAPTLKKTKKESLPKPFRPKVTLSSSLTPTMVIRSGSLVNTSRVEGKVVNSFDRNKQNSEVTYNQFMLMPLYYARKFHLFNYLTISKADEARLMNMTIQEIAVLQREINREKAEK